MFANCLPNTLDTTVNYTPPQDSTSLPDTFIVTGDIQAMWLRDSTNQVLPYIRFAAQDTHLRSMLEGLLHRQVHCILLDPYANAFNLADEGSRWLTDTTYKLGYLDTQINAMTMKLHERKFELDSMCAVLRLSNALHAALNSTSFATEKWAHAIALIVDKMEEQQAATSEDMARANPPYFFQRSSAVPTDTLMHGVGVPARRCGLIKSPFRPSDDASALPFPTAANAMAVVNLRSVAEILSSTARKDLALRAIALAEEVEAAIKQHSVMNHTHAGKIYAYEVDGFGNGYFMDDANIPSLLSLPYLGFTSINDELYQKTRSFVLSDWNPYFFEGDAGAGIGGPHVGYGYIWPMSLSMRALTSTDEDEVAWCIYHLLRSNAGTGLTHESFFKDSVDTYTRPWFAWSNSLFGELMLHVEETMPEVLSRDFSQPPGFHHRPQ
eukprot:TRINITY_DN12706_c0_g1_i2.p1 TRINITY_DN12706_c0_g1~~TRINITY_DN12706_c0_g1_i2.p1  ORF type:complete len:499 (+),score=108.83 TRINITY_DN12706_c0_g1_i2:186-1499(+)